MDQDHLYTDRHRDFAAEAESTHVFVNAYGQSNSGRNRSSNEDQFLIAVLNRQLEVFQTSLGDEDGHDLDEPAEHGWVFLVADGLRGHVASEEASALTARASLSYLRSTMPWFATLGPDQLEHAERALKTVVHRTHSAVLVGDNHPTPTRETPSALTLAYVLWPHLFVVHTGVSRCYLLRDGGLRRLTAAQPHDRDESDRIDSTDTKAAEHPSTRSIANGRRLSPEPIVERWALRDRDTLLLCSHGLTRSVPDQHIEKILGHQTFANARCQALIEAASAAHDEDNTTVIVASFEDFGARTDGS